MQLRATETLTAEVGELKRADESCARNLVDGREVSVHVDAIDHANRRIVLEVRRADELLHVDAACRARLDIDLRTHSFKFDM